MREALAERLLAQVMEWTPGDVAQERPILQAMAALKYDEYQQFSPGIRFVESLALWLNQFTTMDERHAAYKFVKDRLVFFSNSEMGHLVSISYPDHIRPILIKRAANTLNIPNRYIARITRSPEFRILQRRCLFLGLSDGARTDVFRRNNPELSHEQILQTYDISPEKAGNMLKKLKTDLKKITRRKNIDTETNFRMIFLLDDFSGSGISYLRKSEKDGFEGKIAKFYNQLTKKGSGLSRLIDLNDIYISAVIYIATDKSHTHLKQMLSELPKSQNIEWDICIVQRLENDIPLKDANEGSFLKLTDKYYDPKAETEHTKIGGPNVKLGFADCALPIVLSHNTPNNSVFLLWSDPDLYKIRGLFPRIERHKSEQ